MSTIALVELGLVSNWPTGGNDFEAGAPIMTFMMGASKLKLGVALLS